MVRNFRPWVAPVEPRRSDASGLRIVTIGRARCDEMRNRARIGTKLTSYVIEIKSPTPPLPLDDGAGAGANKRRIIAGQGVSIVTL